MELDIYQMKTLTNSKIGALVDSRKDFVIEGITFITYKDALRTVEKIIEDKGFKVRVYTKGRATSLVAGVIPGPTIVLGWAAGIGIGAHNLATFNPDYEIAKNPATGTLTVVYKRNS